LLEEEDCRCAIGQQQGPVYDAATDNTAQISRADKQFDALVVLCITPVTIN